MPSMSPTTQKLIPIGRIGSPHGIKGWVKVNSFTEPPENIFNYSPWLLLKNGQYQPIKVVNSRQQGKNITVHIEGCNDRNLATTYTGIEVFIERSQLKALPADEYYWSDLEGLVVYTKEGQLLGTVESLFATGANDVLVVVGDKKYLIPFLPQQVIVNIDLPTQKIIVDWDPNF